MEMPVGIHIRKWGNSAAVRLPASAMAAAGIRINDPVNVREEEGRIVIEPAASRDVTLEALLAGITPENLHGETDWGAAQGNEAW